ncbi:MAG: restriction endonuclease subunit S [Proteobacteria bacterium]|nr:restriction endonuclease subunit S [Pseudomonadota bacterium]MBU0966814.1 restriction endonuclease subunit S [Pseudomonadota bacterium]
MKFSSEWSVARLKDVIVDMQPGFAQRPGEEDGSIGQIRTHNVSPDGQITLNGLKRVTPSEAEAKKYLLEPGDIIFNNTNSEEWVGKTALYELEEPLAFSNHMTRIRANKALIMPTFLARYLHFLWSIGFSKTRAKRWVSQAGIDQKELASFKLPLPALPEQHRIVDILKHLDDMRLQRRNALGKAKKLPAALFYEMFGDPITNLRGYKKKRLDHLGQLDRGISKNRPRDASFLFGGPYPFIQTGDVTSSDGWITEYAQTYSDAGVAQSRLWPTGTLCITIAANIAKTGILTFDACFPDSIVGFTPNKAVTAEYVMFAMNLYQGLLEAQAPQAAQKNINLQVLRSLQFPVPPREIQDKFSQIIKEFSQHIQSKQRDIASLNQLYDCIKVEAFCGELSSDWREQNKQSIEKATRKKGKLVKRPSKKVTITEVVPEERPWLRRQYRRWLLDHLSKIQGFVYKALREWKGTLIPSEDLDEFMGRSFQIEHLEDANDQIKRALNQLAGLGLIAKISIPNQAGEYVTGYRGLREDELTQVSDRQFLARG